MNRTKTVVILDHHRQSSESIESPVLSYIEPYASSACEMVAEILQYITDGVKLRPIEADAMFAGLMIDTNNFSSKTGVRTFEAAAFLEKSGADITRSIWLSETVWKFIGHGGSRTSCGNG
ncbi:MAG: DHH family phosphoesterase [Frisingicoccus sp.]